MNVSEFFLKCSDLATSWALTSAVVLSKITVAVTPVLTRGGVLPWASFFQPPTAGLGHRGTISRCCPLLPGLH